MSNITTNTNNATSITLSGVAPNSNSFFSGVGIDESSKVLSREYLEHPGMKVHIDNLKNFVAGKQLVMLAYAVHQLHKRINAQVTATQTYLPGGAPNAQWIIKPFSLSSPNTSPMLSKLLDNPAVTTGMVDDLLAEMDDVTIARFINKTNAYNVGTTSDPALINAVHAAQGNAMGGHGLNTTGTLGTNTGMLDVKVLSVNGMPIWERLEEESLDFFALFTLYRDMRYVKTQQGRYLTESRSVWRLHKATGIDLKLINTLADLFQWDFRCGNYDVFMHWEVQKQLYMEQQMLKSDHLTKSLQLMDVAVGRLIDMAGSMKAADAIKLLELCFNQSRLALELPLNPKGGSGNTSNTNSTSSTSVLIQSSSTQNVTTTTGHATEQQMKSNLKNPETVLSILQVLQKSGAMSIYAEQHDHNLSQNEQSLEPTQVIDAEIVGDSNV